MRVMLRCLEAEIEGVKMNDALQKAFATRPGFAEDLEREIDKVTN